MKRVLRSEKRKDEEEEDDYGNNYKKELVAFFFSLDELVSIMLSHVDSDIDLFKLQCVSHQFNRLLKPLVIKHIPTIIDAEKYGDLIKENALFCRVMGSDFPTGVLKRLHAFIGNPYRLDQRVCLIEAIFDESFEKRVIIFNHMHRYITEYVQRHYYFCNADVDKSGWLKRLHGHLRENIRRKPITETIVVRLYNWTRATESDQEVLFRFIQTGRLNFSLLSKTFILPEKTNLIVMTNDTKVNKDYNGQLLRWYHSSNTTDTVTNEPS